MKWLIKNGTIASEEKTFLADLLLEDDKIIKIDTNIEDAEAKCIDAEGCYVMPGAVDIHTHMDLDVGIARAIDDFYTGTIAAACGGTTTIIDHMAFGPKGCNLMHQVKEYHKLADHNAVVDYGFHGVFQHVNDDILKEMKKVVKDEGITSFKIYMTYDYKLSDEDIVRVLKQAKEDGILITVHCENDGIVSYFRKKFVGEGKTEVRYHPLSRPNEAEAEAVNRMLYRELLKDSLDRIFEVEYKNMKDCVESKVFGIGLESYTVGSYDFYLGYGAKKNKIVTLDTGHFHLTESIADKVSSLLLFTPEIMLHVSRPIRWDSDHVVILNDDVQDLAREIVRCDALDRVHIGLDYFDATINRIGAYVIGSRATQKAFMLALLEPIALLRQYEDEGKYFQRLALQEEAKSLPWGAVWDMYCLQSGVPVGESYIAEIEKYESDVTSRRQ